MESFTAFARELGAEILDRVVSASLLMLRLRCSREAAEQVLRYRDARTVDLPPRWGVAVGTVAADVNRFPAPRSPTLRPPYCRAGRRARHRPAAACPGGRTCSGATCCHTAARTTAIHGMALGRRAGLVR